MNDWTINIYYKLRELSNIIHLSVFAQTYIPKIRKLIPVNPFTLGGHLENIY